MEKKTGRFTSVAFILLLTFSFGCKKDKKADKIPDPIVVPPITVPGSEYSDTTGTLKGIVTFPIGFAVEYPLSLSNQKYFDVVKSQGDIITFGNELKNNFIVKEDGTYDFSRADAFYKLATDAGLKVFGHTLVWHSQQRANYYNSLLTKGGDSTYGSELAVNGGFEISGTGGLLAAGWQVLNGGTQFSVTEGSNTNSGTKALKAIVPAGGETYNTQIITKDSLSVVAGKVYTISFYAKADAAQDIQFEIRPYASKTAGSVIYQGAKPITTSYSKITYAYTATANVDNIQFALDLGGTANTIYVDDVSIREVTTTQQSDAELAQIVDNAMKAHIETVISHYVGKIKAWDVINEPFADNGALRNNTNTSPTDKTDIFVWQNYLGIGYATKAFNYARTADPSSDLYMNDYNLETSPTKLAAFIKLATDLKSANAGITGIGTQMHILVSTPKSGITSMLQQMAATGLKVRISELDIRINPGGANPVANYTPSADDLRNQASMYKFIVQSYLKYIPENQRSGITIWGVDDPSSWLNPASNTSANKLEYPLLFDKNFIKKPAFAGIKEGLKGL